MMVIGALLGYLIWRDTTPGTVAGIMVGIIIYANQHKRGRA